VHKPLGIFAAKSELVGSNCSAAELTHLLLGLGQQGEEQSKAAEGQRCMLLKLSPLCRMGWLRSTSCRAPLSLSEKAELAQYGQGAVSHGRGFVEGTCASAKELL
jgi:hypothetical protein